MTLAEARLQDGQRLLGFNDLFIGARTHVSARYQLRWGKREESQCSSGVLVSTGVGSTGWMSSVFAMAAGVTAFAGGRRGTPVQLEWEDRRLMFAVREPFISRQSRATLVAGLIDPGTALIVESRMASGGVIFSDGMEEDFLEFNAGARSAIPTTTAGPISTIRAPIRLTSPASSAGTAATRFRVSSTAPTPPADVNGVSLLVFYDDGNATNNRDIVVFIGNDSNQATGFDLPGWNVTLAGVRYTSGTATLRLVVSDGQSFADPEPVLVNGTVVFPAGQIFDGISLPAYGPSASTLNGGLWDHKSADITSTLAPGAQTLTLTSAPINPAVADCLSLVATVFDLPAGAAPLPPEIIRTLSEGALALLALLTGSAAALQLRRRRTQGEHRRGDRAGCYTICC